MKAEELIIGNLLELKFKENDWRLIHVEGIVITSFGYSIMTKEVKYMAYALEEYRPIPLTEEWLTKFGFERKDKPLRYEKNNIVLVMGIGLTNVLAFRFNVRSFIEIEYVHQLQNLYFALTGEELSYNHVSRETFPHPFT